MTAVDAKLVRGDTTSLDLQALVGGTPVNLAGMVVTFSAKHDPADLEPVLTKTTTGGGVTVLNAAQGQIRVNLETADTADLPARPIYLYYDVQVEDAADHRFTVALGVLELRPDISA